MIASKWLIQTSNTGGTAPNRTDGACPPDVSGQRGPAVLSPPAAVDHASELPGDQLGAVTDAEHRDPDVVDSRVELSGRRRR